MKQDHLVRRTLGGEMMPPNRAWSYKEVTRGVKGGVLEVIDSLFLAKLHKSEAYRIQQQTLEAEARAHPERFDITIGAHGVRYVRKVKK